jgi:hypothetical protein
MTPLVKHPDFFPSGQDQSRLKLEVAVIRPPSLGLWIPDELRTRKSPFCFTRRMLHFFGGPKSFIT